MNKIFDKLIKSKIEKFVVDYKNLSRQIFLNEEGKLIHPGEFGTYREKIIKSLIEPFLPTRLAIGSGFIITSNNNISTQCDIIIYDKENTPVLEAVSTKILCDKNSGIFVMFFKKTSKKQGFYKTYAPKLRQVRSKLRCDKNPFPFLKKSALFKVQF